MVRPQTWEEIRTNDHIITCSSCGRILYYDPSNEPPVEAPPVKKKSKAPASASQPETEPETAPTP
jgi:hypothetical protein